MAGSVIDSLKSSASELGEADVLAVGDMLSTEQAASALGVSLSTIRRLCQLNRLPGALKVQGHWHIPRRVVETMAENAGFEETADSRGASFPSWLSPLRAAISLLAATAILIAGIVSGVDDWSGANLQLMEWGLQSTFPKATEDEILIIVARFDVSDGVPDTRAHDEIRRALQTSAARRNLKRVRTESYPIALRIDDADSAIAIARDYDASLVIWGLDSGVRISTSFLNYRRPTCAAHLAAIDNTESSYIGDPDAYQKFVTSELPARSVFHVMYQLSLILGCVEESWRPALEAASEALDAADTLVSKPPFFADAIFERERLNIRVNKRFGEINAFISRMDESIRSDPSYFLAHHWRGRVFNIVGNFDRAYRDFKCALEFGEPTYTTHQELAVAALQTERFGEAIHWFDESLRQFPEKSNEDFVDLFYHRGLAKSELGHIDSALMDFECAIQAMPDSPKVEMARANAARIYLSHGYYAQAATRLNDLLSLNPGNPNPHLYLSRAEAYIGLKQWDSASRDLDHVAAQGIDSSGMSGLLFNRGRIYIHERRYQEALEVCSKAILLLPNAAILYTCRAQAMLGLGDRETAELEVQKARDLGLDVRIEWGE